MNVVRRIIRIMTDRALAADRFEDPVATLEAAYSAQVGALDEARRGVIDVLASEKRLEIEGNALAATAERALSAAREAVSRGDDAGARAALERETFLSAQRERLLNEAVDIRAQRETLQRTTEDLRRRVELLRTEKLALGARVATARATIRAGEHTLGVSEASTEVARAVERARDHSRDVQARAAAFAELAAGNRDSVTAANLDARLAALKSEAKGNALSE